MSNHFSNGNISISNQNQNLSTQRSNLVLQTEGSEPISDVKTIFPRQMVSVKENGKVDIRKKKFFELFRNDNKGHSISTALADKSSTQSNEKTKQLRIEGMKKLELPIDLKKVLTPMKLPNSIEPATTRDQPQTGRNVCHTPDIVLSLHSSQLTQYERNEITKYSEIYYFGASVKKIKANSEQDYQDERDDYKAVRHDHIAYRYEILDILGKGSFGQVLKVFDHKKKEEKAIKIIRNQQKFHYQVKFEIKILKYLAQRQCEDYNIIQVGDCFLFRGHQCLVFDLLSINLYEFLRNQKPKGLPLNILRRFAIQVLCALKFLRKHNIIHCDLKPENILLRQANKSGIRLIDFGSSCFQNEKLYTYIQSRYYRSPEVILGMNYDPQIDMWSFGCLLAELSTGVPIFAGDSEADQFFAMMEVLGKPSVDFIQKSKRKNKYFDENFNPIIIPNSKGKVRLPGSRSLDTVFGSFEPDFVDFVRKCFEFDPQTRMTPDEALCHPWILEGLAANMQTKVLKMMQHESTQQENKATTQPELKSTENAPILKDSLALNLQDIIKSRGQNSKEKYYSTAYDSHFISEDNTQKIESSRRKNENPIQNQLEPVEERSKGTDSHRANGKNLMKSSSKTELTNAGSLPGKSFHRKTMSHASLSPKKTFHGSTQNLAEKPDNKVRDKSTGNEKKILALTPREVSASTLMDRWKPMLTHRKENSKQNKLFPDIKKDL